MKPRQTRPVFQKFDNPDFAKGFVADPQHSLKFKDEVDRHFNIAVNGLPATFGGPFTRMIQWKDARRATLVPTPIRKLYLDTHKRNYLVVCELRCDAPGFPKVDPKEVCQAGFVIRRRSTEIPSEARAEVKKALDQVVNLQAQIAHLEQRAPLHGKQAKRRAALIKRLAKDGSLKKTCIDLKVELQKARDELDKLKVQFGVESFREGWIPSEFENIGEWQPVTEAPEEVLESYFPLFPLFADPKTENHSGDGKTIYFGVLPTSSRDTDENGNARFDDISLYEARCFVRRHKPDCPRGNQEPDCAGELVWSKPTEIYKLASQSDLRGTAQRPLTIQMPDLAELAAQVAALPINQFSPMKIAQPQSLQFEVEDGRPKSKNGGVGLPQICFFAIPLITIVAFFVLSLFLPIVVFLFGFGLFFLLALRFCILPSVSIDLELQAELDVVGPELDVDAGFDIDADFSLPDGDGNLFTRVDFKNNLKQGAIDNLAVFPSGAPELGELDTKLSALGSSELLAGAQSLSQASATALEDADKAGLRLTADLEYEERVLPSEVTVS